MSAETFIIGSAFAAKSVLQRLSQRLGGLTFAPGRHYRLTLERIDPRGTQAQMAKIRAIVGELAEYTGDSASDLYEQLLERRFGLVEIVMKDGSVFRRPAKRVSEMSKAERSNYIDWLHSIAVEYGAQLRR